MKKYLGVILVSVLITGMLSPCTKCFASLVCRAETNGVDSYCTKITMTTSGTNNEVSCYGHASVTLSGRASLFGKKCANWYTAITGSNADAMSDYVLTSHGSDGKSENITSKRAFSTKVYSCEFSFSKQDKDFYKSINASLYTAN